MALVFPSPTYPPAPQTHKYTLGLRILHPPVFDSFHNAKAVDFLKIPVTHTFERSRTRTNTRDSCFVLCTPRGSSASSPCGFFFLFGVIRKHDRRLEHSQHKILRGRAEYGYFILIIIVIASNNRRYIL